MSSPFEYVDCAMSKEEFIIFLNFLTVNTLKNECRDRGISVSGNKEDLINRLLKHDYIDSDIDYSIISPGVSYTEFVKIYAIGTAFYISYGQEPTLGFYKEDGHNYRRPIYTKITGEGMRDIDNDIKIGYIAN